MSKVAKEQIKDGDVIKEENQKYDKIVLSYNTSASTKEIPKGYFCMFHLDIDHGIDPFLYWNRSSSTPMEQRLLAMNEYFYKSQADLNYY